MQDTADQAAEGAQETADEVAELVRAQIGAISLQSVYDALGILVGEGLVRRIQPSGSPARFEARVGDNHHHLICRVCGRVVDVDCALGAAPWQSFAPAAAAILADHTAPAADPLQAICIHTPVYGTRNATLAAIEHYELNAFSYLDPDAAREALREAVKTIRHINKLEVLGTSTEVDDNQVVRYRTQVRLYFEVETER